MEGTPWGDLPAVTWVACPPTPLPGHPRPPEALGTLEQPWAWGEASNASERGARAAAQRPEAGGAAPSPGEALELGLFQVGGTTGGSSCQGPDISGL